MEQQCLQEVIELEKAKKQGSYDIKGQSFESSSSGCSVQYSKGGQMDHVIQLQADAERMADHYKKAYLQLDAMNRISETLKRLPTESRIVIYGHYQKDMSLSDIATLEKVSKQAVHKKLDKALEEMMEAIK
jgi:DNA-directed RNA polymerase specialized sigma24 family protein